MTQKLRSRAWFDNPDNIDMTALYLERYLNFGISLEELRSGKPIIGSAQTGSDLSPCNRHLLVLAERVREGIRDAGGIAFEFPVHPIQETGKRPTAGLDRNLAYLSLVELLHGYPLDGVVLTIGCDKTTPALLMAAISMDLPVIFLPAGPALRGNHAGRHLGSGSDAWKFWAERRAGTIDAETWDAIESGISRSPGTCMTMGTASTMTGIAEALGFVLPGGSSVLAADSGHARLATETGRRVVELVWADVKPSDLLDERSFRNATRLTMAYGGSTNAAVHLLALAGRAKVKLTLEDLDAAAREVPLLANVRPSGKYLMEDFAYAGGIRALMSRLMHLLEGDAPTVSGLTLAENVAGARVHDDDVICPLDHPVSDQQSLAVLRGSLAPDGAVIKPIAADPKLLTHTGPALVFDDYNDLAARLDSDATEVTPDTVLVLRNAGPLGGPGMPEWGMLPLPQKILKMGIRDMVRISDARMSGTSYGTCVLHVAPESAIGGPLALVQTGDAISLDVPGRRLDLLVDDAEMARRRAAWTAPAPHYGRGFGALYAQHVTQADEGCDFAILRDGSRVPEPEIH